LARKEQQNMGHPFSAILSQGPISPLILSDQLISLAQAAEGAGLRNTANRLVDLAYSVLDEPGYTLAGWRNREAPDPAVAS
jgi:hypothetical protein